MTDASEPSPPPPPDPTSIERIPLVRPPRVRPVVIVTIVAIAALTLSAQGPRLVETGAWDALVFLIFGVLLVPGFIVIVASKPPGHPVIELGPERLRLPVTTRALEFATLRYRDIESLVVRGREALWIGTERGVFLFPAKAFGGIDAARQTLEALRARVETLPDGPQRLARFDAQQADTDVAFSNRRWGTKGLLVLLGLGFALQGLLSGPGSGVFALVRLGVNAPVLVREHGELFRVVTSNLLHAEAFHLGVNGLVLFSLGSLVERLLGTRTFLLVALSAAILGPAATVLSGRASVSMGASGIAFGLLGAFAFSSYRFKARLPLGFAPPFRMWLVLSAMLAVLGLLVPGTDFPAHLGGFLAGLLVSAFFVPEDASLPYRAPPGLASTGALVGLFGVVVVGLGWGVQSYVAAGASDRAAETRVLKDFLDHQAVWPGELNRIAWELAIDPAAPEAQLELAETAARRATSLVEGAQNKRACEDTLATVEYRLGRYDAAIQREAKILAAEDSSTYATQLARFLRARVGAAGVWRAAGAPPAPRFTVRWHDNRGIGFDFAEGEDLTATRTVWFLVEHEGALVGLLRLPMGAGTSTDRTLWLERSGVEPVWPEGSVFRAAWVEPEAGEARGWLLKDELLAYP